MVTADSILASIAATMRDFPPPPMFDKVRLGSMRWVPSALRPANPRDPRVSPAPILGGFGGIPFVIDPNLPPYMAVMMGSGRRMFDPPNIAILDLRRKPQTDDMAQMIDDLRRFNAVPSPGGK